MNKSDLERQNTILKDQIAGFNMKDDTIRKNISEFLGSLENDRWSNNPQIKVLTWPQIYFELGKLKEANSNYQQVEELDRRIMHMAKDLEDLKLKIPTDDV